MNRRQYYETFIISLYKAVHWVIFILVKLYFFSNSFDVKHKRRVTHNHLKCYFSYFPYEVYYLLINMLLFISNAKNCLNFLHDWLVEYSSQTLLVYLFPIWLICFPQNIHNRSLKRLDTTDFLKNSLNW
jgi:hypothetical protein